ncbi:MAG: hypothetical protein IMZ55_17705 [Acidobacteria bacterium]|nr:hypothetical protein [Acidobacteriota bacterium]
MAALTLVACLGEVSSAPPWYAEVRKHLAWPWLEGVLLSLQLERGGPPDLNDPLVLAVLANAWPAGPQWLGDVENTSWFKGAFEYHLSWLVRVAEEENRDLFDKMKPEEQDAFRKKLQQQKRKPATRDLLSEITMGLNVGAFPWLCTDAHQLEKELVRRVRSQTTKDPY